MNYQFLNFELDDSRRELRQAGEVIAIEPKAYQVLRYLLENCDRVVAKEELLEACWPESFVSESALTQCLSRIRRAIQPDRNGPAVIQTAPRQGYRIIVDVTAIASDAAAALSPPPEPADDVLSVEVCPEPEKPPVPPTESAAERRQLTILSCDLVNAAALASQLDPEEFHDIVRHFQTACTGRAQHYGGLLESQSSGGLVIYFGYPAAHEDDAQRAVYTGLDILAIIEDMAATQTKLSVRIGIHTGHVVIEELPGQPQPRLLASGIAPNLASALQTWAEPDTIVISTATYHLVRGYFECQALGEQPLPGLAETVALYQVHHANRIQGRLDLMPPQNLTPFVGRETELAVLRERWAYVQQGMGQVVLLFGEAGMGKSRLAQELKTSIANQAGTFIGYQGSPYHQHAALHPIVDWLYEFLELDSAASPQEARLRAEQLLQSAHLDVAEYLPLMAYLLELDLAVLTDAPQPLTPQQQRQHTLNMLLAIVLSYAEQHPLVLSVEDVHWLDPTTLEWLGLLLDQVPTTSILALMMCRPTFQPPWGTREHLTALTLPRLTTPQVEAMLRGYRDGQLPSGVSHYVVNHTDGVPLFIEEVTKLVLASHQSSDPGSTPAITIPATLQDSLMARLDQMESAKRTAQLGAVIGREFKFPLINAISQLGTNDLRQDLQRLVEAGLLYQRGVGDLTTYWFKHALIQETAYTSLLRRTRQQYHHQIAQVLDAQFANIATAQPELLAHHFTEAGEVEPAVTYWQRAGQRANERSAYIEAMAHLNRGLEILADHPTTAQHARHELWLQFTLASALNATVGYTAPQVVQAYTRVHELAPHVEAPQERFPVLLELARFYSQLGELHTSRELGEQLIALAKQQDDAVLLQKAHWMLGQTLHYLGDVAPAASNLEQSMAFYTPEPLTSAASRDRAGIQIASLYFVSLDKWALGYPDQALAYSRQAVSLAEELEHLLTLAFARSGLAMVHRYRREFEATYEQADALLTLSREHEFAPFEVRAIMLRGWARAALGEPQEGLRDMQQCLAQRQSEIDEAVRPNFLALVAEAHEIAAQPEAGITAVNEALTIVDAAELRFHEIELYRLRAALHLQQPDADVQSAERDLEIALQLARQRHAKSLELRVALPLCRLWHGQGRHAEAQDLLDKIYGWFDEGFDTADAQEARALYEGFA